MTPNIFIASFDIHNFHNIEDVFNLRKKKRDEFNKRNLSNKEWLVSYIESFIYYDSLIANTLQDKMDYIPLHLCRSFYPIDMAIYLDNMDLLYKCKKRGFKNYKNYEGLLRIYSIQKNINDFAQVLHENERFLNPHQLMRMISWCKDQSFYIGIRLIENIIPENVKTYLSRHTEDKYLSTYYYKIPNIHNEFYVYKSLEYSCISYSTDVEITRYFGISTDSNKYLRYHCVKPNILYDNNDIPLNLNYKQLINDDLYIVGNEINNQITLMNKYGDFIISEYNKDTIWCDEITNLYKKNEDYCSRLFDYLMKIKKDNKWAVINRDGQVLSRFYDSIAQPQYYDTNNKEWYNNNLITVSSNYKFGFIGATTINCFLEKSFSAEKKYNLVIYKGSKDGKVYFIGSNGLIFEATNNMLNLFGEAINVYIPNNK